MFGKVLQFLKRDIWRMHLKKLPRGKGFLIKYLRIALVAMRGCGQDNIALRASALTFFSLLSIVPVLAVAFGIAKGFGFENMLQEQLMERIPNQGEVLGQMIEFSRNLLDNTKGGLVAGIGVAILFWSVIKVLGNIERSFNDIWGIKAHRSLARKFSDYLSVVLLCPILLVVSGSITVFISTQIQSLAVKYVFLSHFQPLIVCLLKLLSFGIIWSLFTFIYIFMPNTRVRFSSGLIAGLVAGILYQAVQWMYLTFQVGVAKYNAIYGTFAALPLFLIWLQTSWLIVLSGAEVSFAHQNVELYEFEPDCLQVSYSFKKLLTLQVMHLLVKHFSEGGLPYTAAEISHHLDIPIRLARQIIFELTEADLIAEVETHIEKRPGYQPAHDTGQYTIKYVIDAIEQKGTSDIPVVPSESIKTLAAGLREFDRLIEHSPANKLLKDI